MDIVDRKTAYLSSFFNSAIPNKIMKPFQNKGMFGERDIDRTILNIPFPLYHEKNVLHRTLAKYAHIAFKKTQQFICEKNLRLHSLDFSTQRIAKVRNDVRENIKKELETIDQIWKNILSKQFST